jgi:hypothetical protein
MSGFLWPNGLTTPPRLGSPFGLRPSFSTPGGVTNPFHYGQDMTGWEDIRAVADGVVTFAGYNGGYGNFVRIDHGNGIATSYAHIAPNGFYVRVGDRVRAGQAIARMGTTGRSTGIHLHFEVYQDGRAIDPVAFIRSRLGAPASGGSTPFRQSEEDEMLLLNVNAGKDGIHKVALGEGIFRHFVGGDPFDRIVKIARADDAWQDITIQELPAFLRTYGCDLNIYRIVNRSMQVRDPLTGKVAAGNVWTAEGEIRAQNARIIKKLGA